MNYIKLKFVVLSLFIYSCGYQGFLQKNLPQSKLRGVWVTNVGSKAMDTPESIGILINNCKKYKIDNIFVVVWNKGVTQYPSNVLNSYIGIKQEEKFSHFDPLKAIIERAHKENIKVHAWFEFGFSFAYNDPNSLWIKKFPEWLGRDGNGKILKKNNFMWWNALHPGPQKFLLELITEVAINYDIDGIQGDDRLPAMPSEGGYDLFTKEKYFKAFDSYPPEDFKDSDWIRWRSDQLSDFGKRVYNKVKSIDPDIIVSWAPSIYPWSMEEYLQSWPDWLNGNYADFVVPQFYRYKLEDYKKIIDEIDNQVTSNQKSKIFAGVLTSLGGGYRINDSLLLDMVKYNRSKGIEGEVFFYYETFNR